MFLQTFYDIKEPAFLSMKRDTLKNYRTYYSEIQNSMKFYQNIYINLIDYLDLLKYSKVTNIDFINIFRIKRQLHKPYRYLNLHLRNTLSNYFITLTDKHGNVLISQTAGKVAFNNRKKQKVSPYIMRPMLKRDRKSVV